MDTKPKEGSDLGSSLSTVIANIPLYPEERAAGTTERFPTLLPIDRITPNPDQPRQVFDEDGLESLAASIREVGLINPLTVRVDPQDPEGYRIVSGERRFRAFQLLHRHEMPAIILDLTEIKALEITIVENIQRKDLNPIEEAYAYRQLLELSGHTQEMLADKFQMSRSQITNQLRLLRLPEDVRELIIAGKIGAGHGRALLKSDDPSGLAGQVVARDLTVRQTENLVKASAEKGETGRAAKPEKDPDTRKLEGELTANVGMKVQVYQRPGRESGRIVIRYKTLKELRGLRRTFSSLPSGGSG